MAFDVEYLELMPSTVTVARKGARDAFGNATFGVGVDWRCRIESQTRRVGTLDPTGTVVFKAGTETVLIGPYVEPVFAPGDLFTLPSGAVAGVAHADDIEIAYDEDGPHHLTVRLTSRKKEAQ